MHLLEHHAEWLEHNGKVITLDGLQHRLEVETRETRYPYQANVISVSAVPVSKTSKHYIETKQQLGDDWSVDVLSSDLDVLTAIMIQLGM